MHNLPPCNSACPAGENIQQWLYDAEEGPAKYEAASAQIMQDNPFPAVMAGLLPAMRDRLQPAQLDAAVGINSVERFLGTRRSARAGRFPSTRRRRVSGCWW